AGARRSCTPFGGRARGWRLRWRGRFDPARLGDGLASFSRPGYRQRADQQEQPNQAGENRKHTHPAHDTDVAHFEADPVVAFEWRAGASRCPARYVEAVVLCQPASIAAGGATQTVQHIGRRGYFSKLTWVGGSDIGQRSKLAVGRAPEAELVGGRS